MTDYVTHYRNQRRKRMVRYVAILLIIVLILAMVAGLAYVTGRILTGKPLFDNMTVDDFSTIVATLDPQSPQNNTFEYDTSLNLWNTLTPVAKTLNYTPTAIDDKMYALPENGRVSLDYFSDAMFVGDSLSQGFTFYAPLKDIAIGASFIGVSPRSIVQNSSASLTNNNGAQIPTWDHIAAQTASKIYITIGTNALVASDDDAAFLKYYGDMLDMIRAQFPSAQIYVQSIPPVTAATAQSRPLMDNGRINNLNDQIAVMAIDRGMYYINAHEVLADDEGNLRADMAGSDGTHLKDGNQYEIWIDYLQNHTVYHPENLQYLEESYS